MLKKIKISSVLLFVSFYANSQIVNRDSLVNLQPIRVIYKTNPLAVFIGPYIISSEYKIKREVVMDKQHSWEASFSYLNKNIGLFFLERLVNSSGIPTITALRVNGFKAEISSRYYPFMGIGKRSGIAPHGIFLAPHASYTHMYFSMSSLNNSGNYHQVSNFTVNFLGGLQFIFFKRLSLEFFGGLGIKHFTLYRTKNYVTSQINPNSLLIIPGRFNIVLGCSMGIPLYRKT